MAEGMKRAFAYAKYSLTLEEMCNECVDADHSHRIRNCIANGCGCERANWPIEPITASESDVEGK